MDRRVLPEYRPIDVNADRDIDLDRSSQLNVVLSDADVPVRHIFPKVEHYINDGEVVDFEVRPSGVGKFQISWKGKEYLYKLIYCVDSKDKQEIISRSTTHQIIYPLKSEVIYVWLAYYKGGDWVYDIRNARSIFCINYHQHTKDKIELFKFIAKESRTVEYKNTLHTDLNFRLDYVDDGIVKIRWDNVTNTSNIQIKYNRTFGNIDDQRTLNLRPGTRDALLKIKPNTSYDIFIAAEALVQGKPTFDTGALVTFHYTINRVTPAQIKSDEMHEIYSGNSFAGDTVLKEVLELFSAFSGQVEKHKYHLTDSYHFHKELKIPNDNLFSTNRIELVKPTNVFKGTIKDLQYIARVLHNFGFNLYKSSRLPEEFKKILEYGEFLDEVSESSCNDHLIDNQIHKTINNSNPWIIDNNPQPCEVEYIPKIHCQYDALARVNISDLTLDTTDIGSIIGKVRKLFRDRMYACLVLRLVAVLYAIQEKYEYPVNEELAREQDVYYDDDFWTLYCDLMIDGTWLIKPIEPKTICNSRFEVELNIDTDNTFEQEFLQIISKDDIINNYECWVINNVEPYTTGLLVNNDCEFIVQSQDCCQAGFIINNADGKHLAYDKVYGDFDYTDVCELVTEVELNAEEVWGSELSYGFTESFLNSAVINNKKPWEIRHEDDSASILIENDSIDEKVYWVQIDDLGIISEPEQFNVRFKYI